MKYFLLFIQLFFMTSLLNASDIYGEENGNINVKYIFFKVRATFPAGSREGEFKSFAHPFTDDQLRNHTLGFNFYKSGVNLWQFSLDCDNNSLAVLRSDQDNPTSPLKIQFSRSGLIKNFDGKETPPTWYIKLNPHCILNLVIDFGARNSPNATTIGGCEFRLAAFNAQDIAPANQLYNVFSACFSRMFKKIFLSGESF